MSGATYIVDTDGGVDSLAALAAMYRLGMRVCLVTTTNGRLPAPAAANAVHALYRKLGAGSPPRIVAGGPSTRPLVHPDTTAKLQEVLESVLQVGPSDAAAHVHRSCAAAILQCVQLRKRDAVTLVCLGPLTNVSATLRLAADNHLHFASRLKEVLVLGGDFRERADLPAEYNFRADPSAALRVLSANFPRTTLLPLDVGACLAPDGDDDLVLLGLASLATPFACIIRNLIARGENSVLRHGLLAVALLYRREIFCETENYIFSFASATGEVRLRRVAESQGWQQATILRKPTAQDPCHVLCARIVTYVDPARYSEFVNRELIDALADAQE